MGGARSAACAIIAAIFSFAALLSASAQESATRARLLTELNAAAFNEHFPPIALATGQSGRVTLSCEIAADGASQCTAAEESPEGVGFGAAAVAMAQAWRFAPRMENGRTVASVLRVNVAFENELSTRQALQAWLFVDAPGGSNNRDETPSAEWVRYLSCSWAGRLPCWPPRTSETGRQNVGYYPPRARDQRIDGRALIACTTRADRRLECGIEREAPEGWDFGEYASRLVTDTAARLDIPAGTTFRAPVRFGTRPRNQWEAIPTAGDFNRVYPANAMEREIEGRTLLFCEIRADRRLNCILGQEAPEGEGFGNAALYLSTRFRLSEEAFGSPGYSEGERIRLPISFRIG